MRQTSLSMVPGLWTHADTPESPYLEELASEFLAKHTGSQTGAPAGHCWGRLVGSEKHGTNKDKEKPTCFLSKLLLP